MQCAEEDHCHHAGQEEDDHQRVDDRKPMNLALVHLEIGVPARRPAHVAVVPNDIVGEGDLRVRVQLEEGRSRVLVAESFLAPHRLRHAVRLYLEAHDSVPVVQVRVRVPLELEPDVVVHVVQAAALEADGEAVHVHELAPVGLPDVARGGRKVIHDPVHEVVVVDHAAELVLLLLLQILLAEERARLVDHHPDLVGRVLNHVSGQDLSQVLDAVLDPAIRLAVGQGVVRVRQLRLHGCELVDLEVDQAAGVVLPRGHPRQVERLDRPDRDQRRDHVGASESPGHGCGTGGCPHRATPSAPLGLDVP
mmetsp:Transcript_63223/g.136850  ORF Transcript_63223/g.136850 Transcript_63223/m.136850 type:complete len:307 (+) Transcript_63223:1156-2076(+)